MMVGTSTGLPTRSAYLHLPEHNRIAVYTENVIDVEEYSELLIAFQFESMTGLAIHGDIRGVHSTEPE